MKALHNGTLDVLYNAGYRLCGFSNHIRSLQITLYNMDLINLAMNVDCTIMTPLKNKTSSACTSGKQIEQDESHFGSCGFEKKRRKRKRRLWTWPWPGKRMRVLLM